MRGKIMSDLRIKKDENGNFILEKGNHQIVLDDSEIFRVYSEYKTSLEREDVLDYLEDRVNDDDIPAKALENEDYIKDMVEKYHNLREDYEDSSEIVGSSLQDAFDIISYSDYDKEAEERE